MINGEESCRKVYEDEKTLAIIDLYPRFSEGQCLVIPKKHVDYFYHLEDDEVAALFRVVKIVAQKMERAFNPQMVCLFSRGLGVSSHAHIILFQTSGRFDDPLIRLVGGAESYYNIRTGATVEKLDGIAEKLREA
jgi:histidine triad (HIT) family protein